jgi:pilus assembly protein CpaF
MAIEQHDPHRNGREYAHAAFQPAMDPSVEQQLWQQLQERLSQEFDAAQLLRPGAAVEMEVRRVAHEVVSAARKRAAMQGTRIIADPERYEHVLVARALGMGYLAPFMDDPLIEEITINGSRVHVYRDGHKELVEHLVPDPAETLHLVKRAIGARGARLDESSPEVEVSLPDGSRLTAVIPPMTNVIRVTIRRFVVRAQRLETLVEFGMLERDPAAFCDAAVRAGVNVLVAGPMGSGKTTFLNCLGACIPPSERIISIEDTPELTLFKTHPDCVPLYGRTSNVEGVGAITYRKLIRTALRLRGTRIIVGEVRGPEALDMLVAMATGHEGSMGTIHSESPRGALDQLITFAQMAEEHLGREALSHMVGRRVELVIQLRLEDGRRRVASIFEVTGPGEGGGTEGHDVWTTDDDGRLRWTGIRPRCMGKLERRGIDYSFPLIPRDRVHARRNDETAAYQ